MQPRDDVGLAVRRHLGLDALDAEAPCDGGGVHAPVASEHQDLDAFSAEVAECGGGRGLDGIGDGDQPAHVTIRDHVDDGRAFAPQLLGARVQVAGICAHTRQHALVADGDVHAGGFARDACSRNRRERAHRCDRDAAFLGRGHDRCGEGMLARALERRCPRQHLVFAVVTVARDLGHPRLALGEGAGLVDHQRVDACQAFEGLGAADQDAARGTAAGPHHDRHRSREPEGTRASDDEHRHGTHQGVNETRLRTDREPNREGHERRHHHGGHEDRRDPIGDLLHRCPAALGLADEPHDPREQCVAAHVLGTHHEAAGGVEGAAGDAIATRFLDGHGLARHHRFVDGAEPVGDDAVHGHALARANPQEIPRLDGGERHIGFGPAVVHAAGDGRSEVQERADRVASTAPRAQLQHLTEQHQGHDHRGGFEVDRHLAAVTRSQRLGKETRRHQCQQARAVGRAGADGDEREHVGALVAERDPRALEERPAAPQHHGCREGELEPACERTREGVGERRHHLAHGDREHR